MRRMNRLWVLFLLFWPLMGHAAPPDWMRTVAQQPARKYADDVNAVTLFQEEEYTVKDSGEIVEHARFVYRILRREGRDFAELGVPFTGDSRVNYIKAWSIAPGGQEYETRDKDVMEAGASGYEVYSDLKFVELPEPAKTVYPFGQYASKIENTGISCATAGNTRSAPQQWPRSRLERSRSFLPISMPMKEAWLC